MTGPLSAAEADLRDRRRVLAPPDWTPPKPRDRYDLVVLGGGTAGLVSAAAAAGLGASVALVERDLLGGDCLNTGCVPSKALLASAHRAAAVRDAEQVAIEAPAPHAQFAAVLRRMREVRADLAPHDGAARFRELGVDVFLGDARFVAPDRVAVACAGAAPLELRFARAILATGARPRAADVPGADRVPTRTSETLFDLERRPARLTVVGGGPIGVEMAQAFARLGTRVTLVTRAARLLPRDDPEAARVVADALARDGVRLETGTSMSALEARGAERVVVARRGDATLELAGDEVLLALGRVPRVEGLGLEPANIAHGPAGVRTDARLRTTNRRVWAAGDVTGHAPFTHAADAMARIAVRNALFFGRRAFDPHALPWCTFTDPELAHVGLREDQEDLADCALEALRLDFDEVDRARLEGDARGFAKVVVERSSGRLRGATVVGAGAGELLAAVLPLVARRARARALSDVVYPYPTRAAVFGRLGDEANRRRLTPRARRLLSFLLALHRSA